MSWHFKPSIFQAWPCEAMDEFLGIVSLINMLIKNRN